MLVTKARKTADLSLGSMAAPAILRLQGRSWALWKRLAHGRREFGNPEAFFGEIHVSDTAWMTFTAPGADREDLRIRVGACGVCHSDSGTVEVLFPIESPRVPGHEVVGRIDALGSGV